MKSTEEDARGGGVTHIKLIGDQVIAARLCGRIDFLKLESYNHGKQIDWGFTSAYRRSEWILFYVSFLFRLCFPFYNYPPFVSSAAHIRTGSTGSLGHLNNNTAFPNAHQGGIHGEELRCTVQVSDVAISWVPP